MGIARQISDSSEWFARRSKWRGGRTRISVLLGLGTIALLVAIGAATVSMFETAGDTREVEETLRVSALASDVNALNEQIESARRGYLIDPSPGFAQRLTFATNAFDARLDRLRDMTSDHPMQAARLEEIGGLDAERRTLIEAMFRANSMELARLSGDGFERQRGVQIVRRIRTIMRELSETESRLLSDRNQSQLDSLVQLYLVGGTALALLIGLLVAVILTVLGYNRSLTEAQTGLREANEGLEGAVEKRTSELRRANEEIQRFAYIVSHDLRSPLVNVLGFTSELEAARKTLQEFISDLFEKHPDARDEDVRLAVEEDLPEALGFIRTSTEKMDRLINSILELSRQGRRPLNAEHLDLDVVVEGVIDTLHQRAVDAGATVHAEPMPALESDRLAIEQILSNLVENAIKYLSPDRPGEIRIAGEREGMSVHIDVIDNGRGISPGDHQRIFDLFRRSGQQDQPGEGIGLANVRALAYRLGGTIEVQSELDRGARFRLSLPAKFIETDQA